MFFQPGISIRKAADQAEEVQAKSDELISHLQAIKLRLKSLEPVAVYEDEILKQIGSHKVCLMFIYVL